MKMQPTYVYGVKVIAGPGEVCECESLKGCGFESTVERGGSRVWR